MADQQVHLGFEVGTGKPVTIPLRHMVVTGQTQEAGKTTTLEALIARANLPAIAFVTKRGERSFGSGRRIEPYFRERADWQFVASVLEATMRERLKFERAWIMRASKGAKTLADVQRNVRKAMDTAKGMSADVYLTLDSYLDIVVPRVAAIRWAPTLDLRDGLNVLDVSRRDHFPPELQGLVMRSALEWVYERCDGAITIIPEAWEFLPQGRGSPVKLAAVELIRKGAGLANYVWLDSQDIGGVDKELLRSCPVWLLGVQRETNEIKRTLDNIPAGVSKPKPADVALLEKGQFFACYGKHVIKTYVQPAWYSDTDARAIARGEMPTFAGTIVQAPSAAPLTYIDVDQESGALAVVPEHELPDNDPEEDFLMSSAAEQKLDEILEFLRSGSAAQAAVIDAGATPPSSPATSAVVDEEALYQRIKARLVKEAPAILKVLTVKPEIRIDERIETIEIDGKTAEGRLARLIADGFFDGKRGATEATTEVNRRGGNFERITVYKAIETLCEKGFLYREKQADRTIVYIAVDGVKSNIKRA